MDYRGHRIAEMAVTEWKGASVRVTISLPQLQNTFSSEIVFDHRIMDDLRYLTVPDHLRAVADFPGSAMIDLMDYRNGQDRAKKALKMVSDQIAWALSYEIEKALKA